MWRIHEELQKITLTSVRFCGSIKQPSHWMACCLVEMVLLHAIHLSAIREQFVNIEQYVSRVINDQVACFMNVQAFILKDTALINSRGSH